MWFCERLRIGGTFIHPLNRLRQGRMLAEIVRKHRLKRILGAGGLDVLLGYAKLFRVLLHGGDSNPGPSEAGAPMRLGDPR